MSLSSEEKNTAYEKLTPQRKQLVDKVMENLEKGNLFWTQGWVSSGAPESAITGKKYRGINNLFLSLIAMSENYGDNRWATFKQMEEKGWTFKKDEEGNSLAKGKGASIEYYEMRDKETKRRFDRSVLDGMTASEQQEYMDKNVNFAKENGYVTTLLGRKRYIREINSPNFNMRSFGERAAMNMPLQGTAADIIKIAMIRVHDKFKTLQLKSKLILQVHDELIVDTHPDEVDAVLKTLRDEMQNAVTLSVPLTVETECGDRWYDAK